MVAPGHSRQYRHAEKLVRLSRLAALVLRHRPEEVGITLDAAGFVPVETLAAALRAQRGWESLCVEDLAEMAKADPRRYELCDGRIRARYGHTIRVEQPGQMARPPEWLYVGVTPAEAERLRQTGLRPGKRRFVHLSTTPQAAAEVARRHHSDPVVVVVLSRRASDAGVGFWRAGASLFLTEGVEPRFLLS